MSENNDPIGITSSGYYVYPINKKQESMKVEKGDIIQINPGHPKIPRMFVVVTHPKKYGCQGFLLSPIDTGDFFYKYNGFAYFDLDYKDFKKVGKCKWEIEQ